MNTKSLIINESGVDENNIDVLIKVLKTEHDPVIK